MDAEFSIELGREDPVLDFPWKDPTGKLAYVDLKRCPELLARIEEAERLPELGEFLRTVNSTRSMVETAKCDAWVTRELNAEEAIYDASHKFVSYVDAVFAEIDARQSLLRQSLSAHEQFARKLVALLRRAPETSSTAEVCLRRCYYGQDSSVREGFYFTLYVSGYGNDETSARRNWEVGLKLMGNAILQLST
ncbi:MAG: hypothetical protein ABSG07_13435 [Terriglobales bacterium]|jgi:hypothetical protein